METQVGFAHPQEYAVSGFVRVRRLSSRLRPSPVGAGSRRLRPVLIRTIAGLVAGLVAASCAYQGEFYKVAGTNDPYPWAFAPVIAEAYFRHATGESFYDRLGEEAYRNGTIGLCTQAEADEFVADGQPACWFVNIAQTDDCSERNDCVRYRLSPVLQNDSMRRLVAEAVSSPCAHLSSVDGRPRAAESSNIGQPLSWTRRTLHCNDSPVRGYDVHFEPDGEHVRFLILPTKN